MIAIVNYGVGNLASVKNMLKKGGHEAELATEIADIENASKIILPGIGAFDHCMQKFNASGLRPSIIKRVFADKIPILGICVGMQMMMENSEEGKEPGLGWISGTTIRFKRESLGNLKIPHMGWTDVRFSKPDTISESLGEQPRFYFVHSYHVVLNNIKDEMLSANYGYDFTAALSSGNIYGVQFHPEKSHRFGLKILDNFSKI